jgi:hypothetical protein
MRFLSIVAQSALVAIWMFAASGCSQSPTAATSAKTEHEHAHEVEGPHGGHIIELGAPNHHAELTHDEQSHRIGVYLLDGSAKAAAPIAAESITINVSIDGTSTPYMLPAVAQPGDAEGKSSYFEIDSEPLCKIVCGESEAENINARISIPIDGKPFVGIIDTDPHEHDHGHDHGHEH